MAFSMAHGTENIQYTPWQGSQHPTDTILTQYLQNEGLRAFKTKHQGNYRTGILSHGYYKALFCVQGKIEILLPDSRQRVTLRPGDRLNIGAGVRHSLAVGVHGAILLEGTPARVARR